MEPHLTPEQIKLVNIINDHYSKAIAGQEPVLLLTTYAVYTKLQSVYPSEAYTPEDVYLAIKYLEFDNIDSSEGTIKWLLSELK